MNKLIKFVRGTLALLDNSFSKGYIIFLKSNGKPNQKDMHTYFTPTDRQTDRPTDRPTDQKVAPRSF